MVWSCRVNETWLQPRPGALCQRAGLRRYAPQQPTRRQISTASDIVHNFHGGSEHRVRIDAQAQLPVRTGSGQRAARLTGVWVQGAYQETVYTQAVHCQAAAGCKQAQAKQQNGIRTLPRGEPVTLCPQQTAMPLGCSIYRQAVEMVVLGAPPPVISPPAG